MYLVTGFVKHDEKRGHFKNADKFRAILYLIIQKTCYQQSFFLVTIIIVDLCLK